MTFFSLLLLLLLLLLLSADLIDLAGVVGCCVTGLLNDIGARSIV